MRRRAFLAASAGAARALAMPGVHVGIMDSVLRLSARPAAVALAARLGLDGVQIGLGRSKDGGRLPLSDAALQNEYLAEAQRAGIELCATYLDQLQVNCLKNDALAPKWISEAISINQRLKIKVLMLLFFEHCSLQSREEMDTVAGALKELAPQAEAAGVILGVENTISAADNARLLDQAGSRAVQVYYDIGNSTLRGFDVPAEIRWLGRSRICQFHLKDRFGVPLGEGKVDLAAALRAMKDIGYQGFANIETFTKDPNLEEYVRRNLEYVRRQMAAV